jgi:hypothetical protein
MDTVQRLPWTENQPVYYAFGHNVYTQKRSNNYVSKKSEQLKIWNNESILIRKT